MAHKSEQKEFFVSEIPEHDIPINYERASEFLAKEKFPAGLVEAFLKNLETIPMRFFVCDDSGSMNAGDGNKLMETSSGAIMSVTCSRWNELTQSLNFHAELAAASNAPTEFRFLNGPPSIVVGDADNDPDNMSLRKVKKVLDSSPSGQTPLCSHIAAIVEQIKKAEMRLRNNNQTAVVCIFTDGASSDGDLVKAMKPLERLPCWVVIKLATDDDNVVNYWNSVDGELEIDMDVLDDYQSEAKEIYEHNPWLCYGLPLHRLREFGFKNKELDLIDEAPLSVNQMMWVVSKLLNVKVSDIPHPEAMYQEFKLFMKERLPELSTTYNPVTNKKTDWVDYFKLKRTYGKRESKCSIM